MQNNYGPSDFYTFNDKKYVQFKPIKKEGLYSPKSHENQFKY